MSWPALKGFNFEGGTVIQPEFTALLVGLVLYTSSFVAEIVRSGILALNKGQSEAAMAIGLSRGQVMRLVLLPTRARGSHGNIECPSLSCQGCEWSLAHRYRNPACSAA